MITETQLRSQGYRETQRTDNMVTYQRDRTFTERFFKGLLATLCTIAVIPLFLMGKAVKQMWADAFSPVDRKIIALAESVFSPTASSEGAPPLFVRFHQHLLRRLCGLLLEEISLLRQRQVRAPLHLQEQNLYIQLS